MNGLDSITIIFDKSTGKIILKDSAGNEKVAKGVLLVAHNMEEGAGICIANGDPSEIARGLGEGMAQLVPRDPYYWTVYRSILKELATRTGAAEQHTTPDELLARWETEDVARATSQAKKEIMH